MTRGYDDEIMGMEEELREQGYSESNIERFVRQAQEDIEAKGRLGSLEAIKKRISEEWATEPPPS